MTRLATLLAAACATPALGQAMRHDMAGMSMPGMAMPAAKKPAPPTRRKPAAKLAPAAAVKAAPAPAPAHEMEAMPGMDMGARTAPTVDAGAAGTALPAGDGAPPAPPADRAADRFHPPGAMARADRRLRREHGGMALAQVMFNLAEFQLRDGRDGYRWDGEGRFGGDVQRLVVKSEGDGRVRGGVDDAEVQALYARAIDPYFDLHAGVRQDLGRGAKRTYATIGIEGLAPYWFEVEAALFLSSRGDLLGRLETYYDLRLTQRLLLQPRVELNFAAQDVAASRIGAGLSDAELGLRLRYEIGRRFAPYVGLSWERRVGDTARFARADGEDASARSVALGIRTAF